MKKRNLLSIILNFIFSFIFSCCLVLVKEINYVAKVIPDNFIKSFHFDFSFFAKSLLLSIIVFGALYLIFYILDRLRLVEDGDTSSLKKICIINFTGILITGIVLLLVFYPGHGMNDTFYILYNPIGLGKNHPIVYNLIITIPFRIFNKILNNMSLAYFLTQVLQLIIIDCFITFIIGWFYKTFKNKISTIILMLYFIFTPIVINYNTVLLKDSVFAILWLAIIPILHSLITTKGDWLNKKKNLLLIIILFSLVPLIRNNGIFVIILLLVVLTLVYRNHFKKWLLVLLVVILSSKAIDLIPTSTPAWFQEKVGIPLQQVSYVIYSDGNISKDDKKYLNKILPIDEFKTNYNPYTVDDIKWSSNFDRQYLNDTSSKFLKTWANMLSSNFEGYVKSYLLTTYGNWAIDEFTPAQSRILGLNFKDARELFPEIQTKHIFPDNIQKNLENFFTNITTYLNGGSCLWILVFTSLYIIYKKEFHLLILTVPLFGIWGTLMIASPLSTALRYMSPFVYTLPLIILITLLISPKNKTSNKKKEKNS